MSGEDLLTLAQVSRALNVSEDWLEGQRFRLPCEVTLRDGSIKVRRRDLAEWARAARPKELREPERPTHAQLELMRRASAAAARHGEPGWRP